MLGFVTSILQIFGVVFLRFNLVPRLWCVWLVAANLACLIFITHVEAQVVLAVTLLAVAAQALIHGRIGFTRILGTTHVLWLPMFAWFATRADSIAQNPALADWLLVLVATNMTSLVVDTIDGIRFWRGERSPHYSWVRSPPT
jgi:hypothetical protein